MPSSYFVSFSISFCSNAGMFAELRNSGHDSAVVLNVVVSEF